MTKPIIWSIGGADSGGGAGVQADSQTIQALGGHACTVISAITAQNSVQISHIEPVSLDTLNQQLNALATDLWPLAIKIGMLCNAVQIAELAECLLQIKKRSLEQGMADPFIVWDPVLLASCGVQLASLTLTDCRPLLPLVDLLTPNANELQVLSGVQVTGIGSLHSAAKVLLQQGVSAVLAKGGHIRWNGDSCQDWYISASRQFRLSSERIKTEHNHGTGCSFASAIATSVALKYPIEDAVCIAKAYINQGLKAAKPLGKGPGPLAHSGWPEQFNDFPTFRSSTEPMALGLRFLPLGTMTPGLYPVVDSLVWVENLLNWGVRTIQLRLKGELNAENRNTIIRSIALAKKFNARLFINDHWRLAIKHQAYGVHLGQEDLTDANLPAIHRAGLRLGVSTHGYSEIMRVTALQPSYIALGHIFPTRTKQMPSKPQGLLRLRHYVALLPHIPTVAIGGIGLAQLEQVSKTGVGGIAMVTAITEAKNPEHIVKSLLASLNGSPTCKY